MKFQIKDKIKNAIRKWLGFDKIFMGIDIGSGKTQSAIVIVSRLNGGQVRIIDSYFRSMSEVEETARSLRERYGISRRASYIDYPYGAREDL